MNGSKDTKRLKIIMSGLAKTSTITYLYISKEKWFKALTPKTTTWLDVTTAVGVTDVITEGVKLGYGKLSTLEIISSTMRTNYITEYRKRTSRE